LIPFGDDFSFQKAEETYEFIANITAALIDPKVTGIARDDMKFEFVLSTPSRYWEALKIEAAYNDLYFPVVT
jgi:hypothetical protein